MTTRVSRGRICLSHSIARSRKPPTRRKYLSDISHTSWVIAHLVSDVVAKQPGSVVVEFVWHHSIALPRKPHVGCKLLLHISYTSPVIADFVSNFVAMATGVGHGKICLASFNSPTLKTPCYTQRSRGYLLYRPSYSRFCPKFCCYGNGGWSQ